METAATPCLTTPPLGPHLCVALAGVSLLLAVSTLTHQPDYKTDFEGYADYVTTTPFLVSHLLASIGGAALGVIGAIALVALLVGTPAARRCGD